MYLDNLTRIFIVDIAQLIDQYAVLTLKEKFVQLATKPSHSFNCKVWCGDNNHSWEWWHIHIKTINAEPILCIRRRPWASKTSYKFEKWWQRMEQGEVAFAHNTNCHISFVHVQRQINSQWKKMI